MGPGRVCLPGLAYLLYKHQGRAQPIPQYGVITAYYVYWFYFCNNATGKGNDTIKGKKYCRNFHTKCHLMGCATKCIIVSDWVGVKYELEGGAGGGGMECVLGLSAAGLSWNNVRIGMWCASKPRVSFFRQRQIRNWTREYKVKPTEEVL